MLCNVKNGQCVLKPKCRSSRSSSCSSISKKCRKKALAKKCKKAMKKCRSRCATDNCDTGSVIYVKEVKCGKTAKPCGRKKSKGLLCRRLRSPRRSKGPVKRRRSMSNRKR